jgi:hypothetical protein
MYLGRLPAPSDEKQAIMSSEPAIERNPVSATCTFFSVRSWTPKKVTANPSRRFLAPSADSTLACAKVICFDISCAKTFQPAKLKLLSLHKQKSKRSGGCIIFPEGDMRGVQSTLSAGCSSR